MFYFQLATDLKMLQKKVIFFLNCRPFTPPPRLNGPANIFSSSPFKFWYFVSDYDWRKLIRQCALTSSFTKYNFLQVKNSFAIILNGPSVLKLIQLANGDLFFSQYAYSTYKVRKPKMTKLGQSVEVRAHYPSDSKFSTANEKIDNFFYRFFC